jgi:hypothetical protein
MRHCSYLIVLLILVSCDRLYFFGTIHNQTGRNIIYILNDRDLLALSKERLFDSNIPIGPGQSGKLTFGFGPVQVEPSHVFHLYYLDRDSVMKYKKETTIDSIIAKAYLGIDSVTQQQIIDRNVVLNITEAEFHH